MRRLAAAPLYASFIRYPSRPAAAGPACPAERKTGCDICGNVRIRRQAPWL